MASSKWERYIIIGVIFGVLAFGLRFAGDGFGCILTSKNLLHEFS